MPTDTLPSRLHDDASTPPLASHESRHATAGDIFFILVLIGVVLAIIGMLGFGIYTKLVH